MFSMNSFARGGAALAAVSVLVAGCTTPSQAPASAPTQTQATPPNVTIMVGGLDKQIYLTATLAKQLGYYDAEGVNVQLVDEPSGQSAETSLLAGEVQVAFGSYDATSFDAITSMSFLANPGTTWRAAAMRSASMCGGGSSSSHGTPSAIRARARPIAASCVGSGRSVSERGTTTQSESCARTRVRATADEMTSSTSLRPSVRHRRSRCIRVGWPLRALTRSRDEIPSSVRSARRIFDSIPAIAAATSSRT